MKDVKKFSSPDVKFFLIGNKKDLESEREVQEHDGRILCEENEMDYFVESSAKEGINTKEIFTKAGILLYENALKYTPSKDKSLESISYSASFFTVTQDDNNNKKIKAKKKCC